MRGGSDEDERAFYAAESNGPGTGAPSQFTYMRDTRERYKEDISESARFNISRTPEIPNQRVFSGSIRSSPSSTQTTKLPDVWRSDKRPIGLL